MSNTTSDTPELTVTEEKHPAEQIADFIEQYGWTRGGFGSYERGFCISGAGSEIFGNKWFDQPDPYQQVVARIKDTHPDKGPEMDWWHSLSVWNDVPGRTKEEVIRALRGQQ